MELSDSIALELKKEAQQEHKTYRMDASSMSRRKRETMKRRRKRKFGKPLNIFTDGRKNPIIEKIGSEESVSGTYDDSPDTDSGGFVSPYQSDRGADLVKRAINKWAQENALEVEITEDENT